MRALIWPSTWQCSGKVEVAACSTGRCELSAHHLAEAEAAFTRERAVYQASVPAGHYHLGAAALDLADVALARGDRASARTQADAALNILEKAGNPALLARARTTLARVETEK